MLISMNVGCSGIVNLRFMYFIDFFHFDAYYVMKSNFSKGSCVMIIKYVFENLGPFKKEQTVFFTTKSNERNNDIDYIDVQNFNIGNVSPVLAFFGANGSGKSTAIKALGTLSNILRRVQEVNEPIHDIKPFKFDKKSKSEPTFLSVTFLLNKKLFTYDIYLNSSKIFDEELSMKSNDGGNMKSIFRRVLGEDGYSYNFNEEVIAQAEGIEKKDIQNRLKDWESYTKKNESFIAVATKFNSLFFKQVHDWCNKIPYIDIADSYVGNIAAKAVDDHSKMKTEILDFLNGSDLNFKDYEVKKEEEKIPKEYRFLFKKMGKNNEDSDIVPPDTHVEFELSTFYEGGQLSFREESSGTQAMIGLAVPVLRTLETGGILILDEIQSKLHPHLVKYIVSLFNDKHHNKNNAQLIFTTHDTHIMNKDVSVSEIIICDKKNLKSSLFSMSSFNLTERNNIEKMYMDGQFRGIPYIRTHKDKEI